MEPVDQIGHVKIIFGNPCVFIVETPKGTIVGSAISHLRNGGNGFVNHLANQLLHAALELNEVRDFDSKEDPTIEPPDYFRGIGDNPP